MDQSDAARSRKAYLLITIPKNLAQYVLVPFLLLRFLARPISDAVRLSNQSVFRILLAAFGAVSLNWCAYSVIHRKRPSLLVIAHSMLCLLAVVIIQYIALPGTHALTSTLAVIGGFLALAFLLLLSFWLASRHSKPAHVTALCIWVILGFILCGMAYRVVRDIESRIVSLDTWITIGSIAALILGLCSPAILSAFRRAAVRRRAAGFTAGQIVQIVGETRLDRDGDLVTRHYARIVFTADDVPYEAKADISRHTVRRFGREAFIGREVPVRYDPADPAGAFVKRIDRHIFDRPEE